eukprot:TRINITY_DN10760_c0_g1_i1.p1 TRINITY_DN10760_c0_g1~~TRINITY_DN10760_c0_g1_i1.p1  ORF type:complete len:726 (-),score=131.55 TRINITY_DN10760_c0_g1_i1:175-2352(-)
MGGSISIPLQFNKSFTKGEKYVNSVDLNKGCYILNIHVSTAFNPARGLLARVGVHSKKSDLHKSFSFQLRANRLIGNTTWTETVEIKENDEPVKIDVDLEATGTIYVDISIKEKKTTTNMVDRASPTLTYPQSNVPIDEDKRRAIIDAFHRADTDHNGILDYGEFSQLMKFLFPNHNEAELQRMYSQIDKNRNGSIEIHEFLDAAAQFHITSDAITKFQPGKTAQTAQTQIQNQTQPSNQPTTTPTPTVLPAVTPTVTIQAPPSASAPIQPLPPSADPKFEWEIPYDQLNIGQQLGEGHFGVVYKAKWRGISVAVKELKVANIAKDEDAIKEFRKEIGIMGKLRHPNVVLFIGGCTQPPHLCMVTEFLSGGSLFDMIHKQKRRPDLITATKMVWQTSLGLNYLHLSEPQILHRDLKSMNLLVDEHNNVKLCDFGLSCIKSRDDKVNETVGSPFWMAPEVFQGSSYNEKADIYSFAICVYEIVTGVIPFSDKVDGNQKSLKKVVEMICNRQRAVIPDYVPLDLKMIINEGWAPDPEARPSMDIISDRLEKLMQNQQTLRAGAPTELQNRFGGMTSQIYHPNQQQSYYSYRTPTAPPSSSYQPPPVQNYYPNYYNQSPYPQGSAFYPSGYSVPYQYSNQPQPQSQNYYPPPQAVPNYYPPQPQTPYFYPQQPRPSVRPTDSPSPPHQIQSQSQQHPSNLPNRNREENREHSQPQLPPPSQPLSQSLS